MAVRDQLFAPDLMQPFDDSGHMKNSRSIGAVSASAVKLKADCSFN
jgi:hypothetical protein